MLFSASRVMCRVWFPHGVSLAGRSMGKIILNGITGVQIPFRVLTMLEMAAVWDPCDCLLAALVTATCRLVSEMVY